MSMLGLRAFVELKKQIYEVVHTMDYGKRLVLKDYPTAGQYRGIEKRFVKVDLCSGMASKEGDVIFQSDIVATMVETGVVEFKNGCFIINYGDRQEYLHKVHDIVSIKGNIHLNKDLLPKKSVGFRQTDES